MLVVLPFHQGDREQAVKLIGWLKELGGCKKHSLLPVRDHRAEPINGLNEVFGTVHPEVVITDDAYNSWPDAPNNMFCKAARHIQFNQKEPWLFLEPDAIPLKPDWLDKIEAEYNRSRRPFMGAHVPKFMDSPDHMSGVAVYPAMVVDYAGPMLLCTGTGVAFDLIAAESVLAQAHTTDLIQRHPQPIVFTSREQMRNEITDECVLYHPDKKGALIDILRGIEPSEKTEASSSPADVSMPRIALPKEGQRNGDLVFRNGGWRNEPERHYLPDDPNRSHVILHKAKPVSWVEKPDGIQRFASQELADHIEKERLTPGKLHDIKNNLLPAPWKNRKESEREVALLCEALALFAQAPAYKKRVRDALRKVKIIT